MNNSLSTFVSCGIEVSARTLVLAMGAAERAASRRALYMPALVAVRHDPHLRGFYEHLLARGKTKMQALVASMRKLLHAIFGMFKHDQLFDGAKVYATPPLQLPAPQEVACA